MIFIANILELNGGTTFLVRTCRALQKAGHPCAVLVLRRGGDDALAAELAHHAHIVDLDGFQLDRGRVMRRHLGAFAPIDWPRLASTLAPFGPTLHAMGAFGLIAGARLVARMPDYRLTIGIYHQNEFIYRESRFFSASLLALFRRLPQENILFFNELSRDNYARFHAAPRYLQSRIAPIGIDISSRPAAKAGKKNGYKIVSVGNLEAFKTYNRLIIDLLPRLQDIFPVSYHIYGSGDQMDALRAKAKALHVEQLVTFHGRIPYDRLPQVWEDTDLFVGSGTALIEAAAAGLPALVGVESMPTPHTYGFLSDIQNLSYNEFSPDLPLQPMETCITRVFQDPAEWQTVAAACTAKAQDFSVERTAQGLIALAQGATATPDLISGTTTLGMLAGLPLLALRDGLLPQTAFARRRNQSFMAADTCSR